MYVFACLVGTNSIYTSTLCTAGITSKACAHCKPTPARAACTPLLPSSASAVAAAACALIISTLVLTHSQGFGLYL